MRVDKDTARSKYLEALRAARAKPLRYVYIDGELYWLASHAAEQMERCMEAMRQPITRFRFEQATEREPVLVPDHFDGVEPGSIVKVEAI